MNFAESHILRQNNVYRFAKFGENIINHGQAISLLVEYFQYAGLTLNFDLWNHNERHKQTDQTTNTQTNRHDRSQQEAQLLLEDRATRKHAKDS